MSRKASVGYRYQYLIFFDVRHIEQPDRGEYDTVRYPTVSAGKKIFFFLPNRKGCKYFRQKEKANLFNNCSSLFCLGIHERLGKEDPKQEMYYLKVKKNKVRQRKDKSLIKFGNSETAPPKNCWV
jgi:hypothetical protein